jgi:methylthioribulose-1-phosphate dehydratase
LKPADYSTDVQSLCEICHLFGERGWCRATSGNFSLRIDEAHCLITRSGCEKSRLSPDDLMICDIDGKAIDPEQRPSAETPLHTCLYQLDDSIGAVLHTHSVSSTLLSLQCGSLLRITGFEMQKALAGITSHVQEVLVPVFDNSQDMDALATTLAAAWHDGRIRVPGFLIAGHGLYAWGNDAGEAQRHTEGFEFLFECLWQQALAKLP